MSREATHSLPPRGSAVRAVLAEITWRRVLAAQLIAGLWLLFRYLNGRYFSSSQLPPTFVLSGIVIDELTAISLLIALLSAQEAVRRGGQRFLAYSLALLMASVFAAIVPWYVRQWLGLQVQVDVGNFTFIERKWMNMIFIGLDTLIYGAFITLVYTSRLRELEYIHMARTAELERAQRERDLTQSRLAEAQARLEPEAVLSTLGHIKALYERASPDAELALDDLVRQLRTKLESATAATR
jgi:hypothetical protein